MYDLIYKITRWTLGGVFIYAGGIKLLAPGRFAALIGAYGIIPDGLLMVMAIMLASMEVAAGTGLMFDIEGSLGVVTGLLILFIVILAYAIWMGLDVDCGCFGPDETEAVAFFGLRQSLNRDLLMLVGTVFLYGWRRYHAIKPVKASLIIQKLEVVLKS